MSDAPESSAYNILAFIFGDKDRARWVSEAFENESEAGYDRVIAKAVVEVDANGKPHVHEAGHGGRGAGIGLAAGGLLGLIGGPVGLLFWAVAGGVVGGFIGKHSGQAIPPEDLKKLATQMNPDTSAILVIAENTEAEDLMDQMKGYTTNVVTLTVGDKVSGEIADAVSAQTTAKA